MNTQLDLFALNRGELEKELTDREGIFWLFMVYYPKDCFLPPDATQAQREKAEREGRKPIPEQEKWDDAMKNAQRIEEIRETLKHIGKVSNTNGRVSGTRPQLTGGYDGKASITGEAISPTC